MRAWLFVVCAAFLLAACGGSENDVVDQDGDGVPADEDCDDSDAAVYPGVDEVCDGLDNDCDGDVDEDATDASTWYADQDGDGYGATDESQIACEQPEGTVEQDGDCDDSDSDYHPGADESDCSDPNDYNCDGSAGYEDGDDDGFAACEECDDTDPAINPDAEEVCDGVDNDCDDEIDEDVGETFFQDADGDGFGDPDSTIDACDTPVGYVSDGSDCDDSDAAVYPGAVEVCDETDNDCDGETDEGVTEIFYADSDGDGFGTLDATTDACVATEAYVADSSDCDDTNPEINSGAAEVCDRVDNDCDGEIDEDVTLLFYADGDGDGYGDPDMTADACVAPEGYVADDTDCDDVELAINPGAAEVCDGVDNDCDGETDEGVTSLFYADTDGDGYGDPVTSADACVAPEGYIDDDSDCDDSDGSISPEADEVCDGADNNCDGETDEDTATDAPTWYADSDGDGFGDPETSDRACSVPEGFVADHSDCDDGDGAVNPDADEVCNDIDDDCNEDVDDEPVDGTDYYPDSDGDGFGGPEGVRACAPPSEDDIEDHSDCDDEDPRSYPGGLEICDEADNDCNGVVDEECIAVILIQPPSADHVADPERPAVCGSMGEMTSAPTSWRIEDLPAYMDMLDGVEPGLTDSAIVEGEALDFSIRCGGDYLASPGNYTDTTIAWPELERTGSYGGARVRGYINIGPDDPLNYTLGLIGNDALTLVVEGEMVVWVNWADGRWKKFRYVSFPGPGLYAFEVQWLSNLICDIDPFELVWAEGFVPDYHEYDTMCNHGTCVYANNIPIPDFSIIGSDNLAQSTDGSPTDCVQCFGDDDCGEDESCNSAGICQ